MSMPLPCRPIRLASVRGATGLLLLTLLGTPALLADSPQLDRATLEKLKAATVYLQVKLPDGSEAQGSGFFAVEPGLVVTNAHVLGMLEANSRPPRQVAVVVSPGTRASQTLRGQVLGVDRNSDLAVLRVAGNKLPAPLVLGSAAKLIETQEVFIFGFPLGRLLGKNITVSRSTVSSLRKNTAGAVVKVQVNGGMHPGNSGGPVTDAAGQVVGVAVSGIENTTLNFAVPAEYVRTFLNGYAYSFSRLSAYRQGREVRMPVMVHLADPLGRVRKVVVESWTGPSGKPRPSSASEPKGEPGDSPKQVLELSYDKKGTARGEVALPALSDPKHVYWMRPVVTDAGGNTKWVVAHGRPLHLLLERKPVTLKYRPRPGDRRNTDITSTGTLKVRVGNGETKSLRSNMSAGLFEQADRQTDDRGNLRVRHRYRRLNITVLIDGKPLTAGALNPALKNLKLVSQGVEMDGDGGLAGVHADLGRVPREHKGILEDVTDQVLQSLPLLAVSLPGDTVKPLQRWKSERLFKAGPLGYSLPAQARLEYTYLGMRDNKGKAEAAVELKGTIRGAGSNSAAAGGSVQGLFKLSPETGAVVEANVTLKIDMDVRVRSGPARVAGELTVGLRRGPVETAKK